MIGGTHVWRGLDEPRMEIAHIDDLDHAHGTQIGIAYELRWDLHGDVLDLEINGEKRPPVTLEDADFFDLGNSPFFNSLPVVRDGLLEKGPARDYVMRFVAVPSLEVTRVPQRYEPLGDRVVRYTSGSFHLNIAFDPDGLVTLYQDYLERVT